MSIDYAHLSPAEKLKLVEEIWDNLSANPEDVPIPDWQVQELLRRKEEFEKSPRAGLTWEQVKERILGQNGG
jgi:putative addiction module component (TIGR02574 family)